MPTCSVSTCRNSSSTLGPDSDIIFHPFPRSEKRSLEWFIKCKRRDKKRANFTDRICSIHFTPDAYERDIGHDLLGKPPSRKLKETATPTQSLPYLFIKPADARKLLTPTLARQLNKRAPQSSGGNYKMQKRKPSSSSSEGRSHPEGLDDIQEQKEPNSDKRVSKSVCESSTQKEDEIIVFKANDHCQKLLSEIFNDEIFMDVTLITEEKRIRAHKAVLRQASGFFKKTLEEQKTSEDDCEIHLDNISYEDLSKVIAFIYHGQISVKSPDLNRFIKASELLEVSDIKILENDQKKTRKESRKTSNEHSKKSFKKKRFFYFKQRRKSETEDKDKDNENLTKNKSELKSKLHKKNIIKYVLAELQEGLVAVLFLLY